MRENSQPRGRTTKSIKNEKKQTNKKNIETKVKTKS